MENKELKFDLEAIESSFVRYEVGNIVNATIINKTKKGIIVNIGGKKDGIILFPEAVSYETLAKGTKLDVIIVEKNNDDGNVVVSAQKAIVVIEKNKELPDVREGKMFEAEVNATTFSGLVCRFGSYKVFVPASEVDERFVKNLASFKGKTIKLIATSFDDEAKQLVASRKAAMLKDRIESERAFWDTMFVNKDVMGKIVRFAPFGAFANVEGVDCLVHNSECSYNYNEKATDIFKLGEEYQFKIISLDRENGKAQLSYKALIEHPFIAKSKDYNVGDEVEAEVTKLLNFGAIMKLPNGIEGLCHINEASNKFVKKIYEVVKVGDKKKVKILAIDQAARKISLSIKALLKSAEEEEFEKENKTEEKA